MISTFTDGSVYIWPGDDSEYVATDVPMRKLTGTDASKGIWLRPRRLVVLIVEIQREEDNGR